MVVVGVFASPEDIAVARHVHSKRWDRFPNGLFFFLFSGWCYRPSLPKTSVYVLLFFLRWFQYLKGAQQALVHAHHGAGIVEFTTVVRGGEQGDQLPLRKELVSVLYDLMGPANEIHVMFLQEPRNHIGAEGEGYATIVFAPASDILVWVGPEQVAEQTTVGNISWTHDPPDLFHGVQIRGETAMHGEDFLINDRSNWEAVEAVSKSLPELDVVSSLALIVEAIDTVYRCTLVVASKDKEILWILDLVGEEEADGF